MNSLAVAILFVAVAYTSASGIIAPGWGVASARGALEGALGGQWIPDVPVAGHGAGLIAPGAAAIAAGPLGLGLGAPLGLGLGAPLGLGLGLGGHGVVSKGALEGALGGQWIPDTHGK